MNRVRWAMAGVGARGVAACAALGLIVWHAAPPRPGAAGATSGPPTPAEKAEAVRRDLVDRLHAELDVLRVEHDAGRTVLARLAAALAEADFAKRSHTLSAAALSQAYERVLAVKGGDLDFEVRDADATARALHEAHGEATREHLRRSLELARKARGLEKAEGRNGPRWYASSGS